MDKIYITIIAVTLFALAEFSRHLPDHMFGLPLMAILVPIYIVGGLDIAFLVMSKKNKKPTKSAVHMWYEFLERRFQIFVGRLAAADEGDTVNLLDQVDPRLFIDQESIEYDVNLINNAAPWGDPVRRSGCELSLDPNVRTIMRKLRFVSPPEAHMTTGQLRESDARMAARKGIS